MIKFELNGVVYECTTPEEAAKLRILLGDIQMSAGPVRGIINRAMVAKSANISIKDKTDFDDFIKVLKDLPKTEFSGELFATALGLQSVTGLGPRLASLTKRFEVFNVHLWDIVEKKIRPGLPTAWSINQDELHKAELFQ